MKRSKVMKLLMPIALGVTLGSAHAEPSVVAMKCSLSGPVVVPCVAAGVLIHEASKGKDAFGPNGEGMKLLHGVGAFFAGCGCATKEDIKERKPLRSRRLSE